MKEEWLFHGAVVPIDVETTAALVAEIKRLIDVIGGMALAQPKQEPVAKNESGHITWLVDDWPQNCLLYTTPPQRTWVGLTDEEIQQCLKGLPTQTIDVYARRIEAKLKEKNNG